ncbi:TBC1 domain family member 5 homolog A-like isoform X2 [Camponotus floridanus]|uniref:TBC1 domain family member 5 homolog A-like isoform X2 n=1 Tax=Camponotus floridanus TaxID=104421 RepID=UPI00059D2DD7|nr:TBC1 domain family member 5 homolog A-like isoform X2 [Camponotus floridanus]
MISHRILGCLFLILLSQYSNARKSNYVETILNSLQRIENLLFKQSTQQTLNCLVPVEKLFALISEASNDDSNEDLGLDNQKNVVPFLKKSTEKNRNYIDNKNYNENINTNINKNIDRARRTLDDSIFHNFNKLHNRNYNVNMNANKNINRKATDFTDFIDENEA